MNSVTITEANVHTFHGFIEGVELSNILLRSIANESRESANVFVFFTAKGLGQQVNSKLFSLKDFAGNVVNLVGEPFLKFKKRFRGYSEEEIVQILKGNS